jgi:hypothetical protein
LYFAFFLKFNILGNIYLILITYIKMLDIIENNIKLIKNGY